MSLMGWGSMSGDSAEAAVDTGVRPGQLLAGRYRVERVLGIGNMGVVVEATHIHLGDKVALKLPLPKTLKHRGATACFIEEARAAARIKSEHVARVTDVGTLENGCPYIVMEVLQGVDLSVWLAERGRISIDQAVEFVLQTCDAVAEVHALGMVHRDIKPSNLFCVRGGGDRPITVKLLDFGISTPDVRHRQARATSGAVVGSPLYMSPEQLQSPESVDARTDIWSLGVLLYRLLAGRTPFHADSVAELADAIATADPAPLRGLRADVPPALERVIATCLQKDPEHRFPSVSELAVALDAFASEPGKRLVERLLLRRELPSLTGCELGDSGGTKSPSGGPGRRDLLEGSDASWPPPPQAPWMLGRGHQGRRSLRGKTAIRLGIAASLGLLAAAGAFAFRDGLTAVRGPDPSVVFTAPPPPSPLRFGPGLGSDGCADNRGDGPAAGTAVRPSKPRPSSSAAPALTCGIRLTRSMVGDGRTLQERVPPGEVAAAAIRAVAIARPAPSRRRSPPVHRPRGNISLYAHRACTQARQGRKRGLHVPHARLRRVARPQVVQVPPPACGCRRRWRARQGGRPRWPSDHRRAPRAREG